MRGLDLSQSFFEEKGFPLLMKNIPDLIPSMAFGMVGEGSECLGLDDEISRDHDYGPRFFIWIPGNIMDENNNRIKNVLELLPSSYKGFKSQMELGSNLRSGICSIEDFYSRYTSFDTLPLSSSAWLDIPESYLARCTNGRVFIDFYGEFTKIRNYLLGFYPDDILRKKLSAYMAKMAQSGQYNYERSLRRKDIDSAFFSLYEFIDNCYSVLFLIAGKYKPYYKLTSRRLRQLNYYPEEIFIDINYLQMNKDCDKNIMIIEKICQYIADIIRKRYNIKTKDTFLIPVAEELQNTISERSIRNLHLMRGTENV